MEQAHTAMSIGISASVRAANGYVSTNGAVDPIGATSVGHTTSASHQRTPLSVAERSVFPEFSSSSSWLEPMHASPAIRGSVTQGVASRHLDGRNVPTYARD
jgi:hypothetical protein